LNLEEILKMINNIDKNLMLKVNELYYKVASILADACRQ